jgi:peptidyl-dipeptidase A
MKRSLLVILATAVLGCPPPAAPPAQPPVTPPAPLPVAEKPATTADADAFVKRFNEEGLVLGLEFGKASWLQNTFITADTAWLAAKNRERWINFHNGMIEDSKRFTGLALTGETDRAINLIKIGVTMPAPKDPTKVARLAEIASELKAMYGKGKYCKPGKGGKEECRDLEQLTKLMSKSRKYDELLDAWTGWRTVAPKMRAPYTEFAGIMNEGSRELGFSDTGDLWKAGYDMTSAEFEKEADRLWQQVKPLYAQLHCYVRNKLGKVYGEDKVPPKGPIPAHLLGNMWAQEWANVYEIVRPFPPQQNLDISKALVRQKLTPKQMVESAESFYTSLGLQKLPETFWTKSMFVKPTDHDAVCHASAWDLDLANDDVRIKMCIDATEDDLVTIYHELGHVYYYLYYKDQTFIFQSGAHDGFHEAIGDALTLSMTPEFYKKIGLVKRVKKNDKAVINQMMKSALEKIAFLPFGKLIDQWRWDIFSGKTKPEDFNASWWKLRLDYQGIAPPVARSEADFDPGAKYHIPNNTPYTRYFLARILQFQFHRAMCQAAGQTGALHECSIYGSKAAGTKLSAMLSMGQTAPWPDALEKLTGTRQMDASAIIDYFRPLMSWLEKENKGRACGW